MWVVLVGLSIAVGLMVLQMAYPVVLGAISLLVNRGMVLSGEARKDPVKVSVVVPVYANDIGLLADKLVNASQLSYPASRLEIIVSGDGELPELMGLVEAAPRVFPIRYHATGTWVGKNAALNKAVELAAGDLVVVSDVDTRLAPEAISFLAEQMGDLRVGGVCGTLKVEQAGQTKPGLGGIQKLYWNYEWWIKNTEMRSLGSVTSCTGQLVAIRRECYPGLPQDVNDDLYLALSVVMSGRRFVAAPDALAFVTPPSKSLADELKRRPRIVAGSLTAIWRHRRLLSQRNTFWFGVCLFIHKVIRRLTPVLLAVILAASGLLALTSRIWLYCFIAQILGYALAWFSFKGYLKGRIFGMLAYLLAFNIGTGLGLYQFLARKGRSKW